ncbi:MAG: hypothetical protein ACK57B_01595 [Betaproteobacteria bacterium]|jgi:hypothetical protein
MQGFWLTLGWGLAALLAASVLVTLVELLRQGARRALPPPPSQPGAVRVDLDVDELQGDRGPAGAVADPEARRAALAQVLHRLQQPGADPRWLETSPTVLTSQPSADLERR